MFSIKIIKENIKNIFTDAYAITFGYKPGIDDINLEYPPNTSFGDFTIACFSFRRKIEQDPSLIASKIAEKIIKNDFIGDVAAVGPYINFKINPAVLFKSICEDVISSDDKFGATISENPERIMVEYLSPNTNKPLHLGHVRNGILGVAISNLLEAVGHKVIKSNLINDRGIHICKSMVAYKKWGGNETPESTGIKGDHFVGNFYTLYAKNKDDNPLLETETQECLRRWENGDKETLDLWNLMNNWAYTGFRETYLTYGFSFDKIYYESKNYILGKNIIQRGVLLGLFEELPGNAVIARLPIDVFGEDEEGKQRITTLIRNDGTSVYITQDIGTAVLKFNENNLTHSIHVVGNEQKYHFKCLFFLLKLLGYSWADKCRHLSYGMVYLPEGKMKSREGNVVDADNIAQEMTNLAKGEILKRTDLTTNEKVLMDHAQKIGLAAIKFFLLRINSEKDIYFDPKESLSFEGNTGPYCQYAYARIQSILSKEKSVFLKKKYSPDFSLLTTEEDFLIARYIMQLPEAIKKSADSLNPSFLCEGIYNIAKTVHQFYHKNRIIDKNIPPALAVARIKLLQATSISIRAGLKILGIETIDKM